MRAASLALAVVFVASAAHAQLRGIKADATPLVGSDGVHAGTDVHLALRYGAEGIGLLRSEFSFLTYEDFPDENQQLELYTRMLKEVGKRPVTIRTLDIGADKYPPYMRVPREENPFLGWRSIRISLEMPGLFKVQLRAILRAAAKYNVRILFPMITTLEEIRRVRTMVRKARGQLAAEGKPYGNVRIGFMLEVPAAAVSIDLTLARPYGL